MKLYKVCIGSVAPDELYRERGWDMFHRPNARMTRTHSVMPCRMEWLEEHGYLLGVYWEEITYFNKALKRMCDQIFLFALTTEEGATMCRMCDPAQETVPGRWWILGPLVDVGWEPEFDAG